MAKQLVAVASLLLGFAFLQVAGAMHGLLLAITGTVSGFSTTELGLLGTGWATGFVAGCVLIPHIVRRVGHVRAYGALASVAAVTILLNLLIVSPLAWILLRALSGFTYAGASMVVESWLNERASSEKRGVTFAIYQMVSFAASTTGQFLLAFSPPTPYFFFALGAIFYCLAILPTALSAAATPRPLKTTQFDIKRLFALSPVAVVVCFCIGLANGAFGTLGPVYAQRIGLPIREVATLTAGALLGGALIQFPIGWLSDRMDRRRVLVAVGIGAVAIGVAMVSLRPRDATLIISLIVVYGAMAYPMYALSVAHANDFAAPDEFVKTASGLLLLYGFGTVIGPAVAAYAMQHWIPEALFAFTATIHAAAVGYALFRMTRRAPPSIAARETFHSLPLPKTVTPESAVLDPRAGDPFPVAEPNAPPPPDDPPPPDEPAPRGEDLSDRTDERPTA